jgi:hypothetical protein
MRRREAIAVGMLLGAGAGAALLAGAIHLDRRRGFVEPPEATGDVGVLRAWAQTDQGPVLLRPGIRRELWRPQDIAFTYTAKGTGPRLLRIELDDRRRLWTMHEVTVEAPQDETPLPWVLHLDDTVPPDVEVHVTIEPPHTRPVTSILPIRLLPRPGR